MLVPLGPFGAAPPRELGIATGSAAGPIWCYMWARLAASSALRRWLAAVVTLLAVVSAGLPAVFAVAETLGEGSAEGGLAASANLTWGETPAREPQPPSQEETAYEAEGESEPEQLAGRKRFASSRTSCELADPWLSWAVAESCDAGRPSFLVAQPHNRGPPNAMT